MFYRKLFLIFIGSIVFSSITFAQQKSFQGKVRDMNTHREIPGVNIYIEGTNIGVMSDVSGRFTLPLQRRDPQSMIVFEHIAYDTLKLPLQDVVSKKNIYLQERVIPLSAIEVEADKTPLEIEQKDLPQAISVLEADEFELRGYLDAGDLLRTEQSVQVEEELSGKKTAAIRGGNPDEVVVLYNGVKMNSAYDNIFDLSLVNVEDIQRFEVIKGSNTALYGSEAFSGVINIVSKFQQDYNIRFQQRFGTYASGNWGIHFYLNKDRLHGSYSFKQGGAERKFSGAEEGQNLLENDTEHHTFNLLYDLSKESHNRNPERSLSIMYVRSKLDYNNQRDNESLLNFNQLISARYKGNIWRLSNLNLTGTYQWLDESQHIIIGSDEVGYALQNRDFDNRAFNFDLEKSLRYDLFDLLLSYQLEATRLGYINDRGGMDEVQIGLESADFQQLKHGFVAISKLHAPTGASYLKTADFDLSFRYDKVENEQSDAVLRQATGEVQDSIGVFEQNQWEESTLKFSAHLSGGSNEFAFNSFMNFGANVKFPTLFQQISNPGLITSPETQTNLAPEESRSLEIGSALTWDTRTHPAIYGFQCSGNYFKNTYRNKFRISFTPGIPVAFYDNVQDAEISGFEGKSTFFLFRKKVTMEGGISYYNISEKAAFPFKYDQKQTLKVSLDHAGYSFQFLFFNEGEQAGWIRNAQNEFSEVTLPSYSNIDLHFGKAIEIGKLEFILNASVRNILDDDFELEGLALRDRRFYVTFAAQY